jgi:hypothetical protein
MNDSESARSAPEHRAGGPTEGPTAATPPLSDLDEARMMVRSWGPMYTADRWITDAFDADVLGLEAAVRADERAALLAKSQRYEEALREIVALREGPDLTAWHAGTAVIIAREALAAAQEGDRT